MLKNPQDRRAMRTAMQIKETMFSFMQKKAIHEITVSEICKACQINRATFYDHYRDVFDLVQDMEQDILLELQKLMDTVSPEEKEPTDVSRLFFVFLAQHRDAQTHVHQVSDAIPPSHPLSSPSPPAFILSQHQGLFQ